MGGKGFEDLEVYQEARSFRKRVYRLAGQLPDEERFGLAGQMRRAAVSVTNCIAEGHGSKSYRHNISYLFRSRGSVCELQDDFNTCEDEEYFEKKHLDDIRAHSVRVSKLLNGYIRYLADRAEEAEKKPRVNKRRSLAEGSDNELTS
ncbi:MAG: four helix bundle protein [Planctomycetaceae bacterium]|nr:four helix bundle protein [Planctomycetaceae bacterium]